MEHETFILALCCLIALCFTMAVIALFALLYAIIGNVWVSLAIMLPATIILMFITAKLTDRK